MTITTTRPTTNRAATNRMTGASSAIAVDHGDPIDTDGRPRVLPFPAAPTPQRRTNHHSRAGNRTTSTSQVPWSGSAGWHRADWGPWGAAESIVKVFAILTGLLAALPNGAFNVPDDHRTTYWVLVGITTAYVFSFVDRLLDRELTALAFWALNVSGHLAIIYAMGAATWPAAPVQAFAALMLIGDLIKVGFFWRTGARVRNLPRAVPVVLTATFAVLYAIALATA